MIDCFFLVTQFFIITFHIKVDECVLPQRMPAGIVVPDPYHPPPPPPPTTTRTVHVHVMQNAGAPVYVCGSQPGSLGDLDAALQRLADSSQECAVRVSYEAAVPFGDVMAVFNTCTRRNVARCGLAPLRVADALPGG
jgi:biopolymer transport protein ExbD